MRKKVLFVIGFFILLNSSATAAPLLNPGTLVDYIALGATGGQIGDLLFYNFNFVGAGSGGAVPIPASGISITPLFGPNPGLQFSAALVASQGQTINSLIMYEVSVIPRGLLVSEISASMSSGYAGDGLVAVAETTSAGNLHLYNNSSGNKNFDELAITATLGPIMLSKDISVTGNSGVAAVLEVFNQFERTAVPEPSTALLLGPAFVGLALWRRKRS